MTTELLTIVVPIFNETAVIHAFYQRICELMDALDLPVSVLFVDDGSTDHSYDLLETIRQRDPRVALLRLSRNFGKEVAMTAGLDHVTEGAAVVIDADLQDPPELILEFVKHWRDGHDMVYGTRTHRDGETWLKKFTAARFYALMQRFSRTPIPSDTGDFRLLSRTVLDALSKVRERNRFMKGLFTWVGFSQKSIPYRRDARAAGSSKWNYWKLWNFAVDGITSFTTAPLKIATWVGATVSVGAFVYGLMIIFKTLVYGNAVPGYPSLMVVVLFLGGLQLLALGVIGEYLGRLFLESKQRPLYLISEYCPRENEGK